MNRTTLFIVICFFWAGSSNAQKVFYEYMDPQDSSKFCSMLILPDEGKVEALLVRDYSQLPPAINPPNYPFQWRKLALRSGIAVLYTVSSTTFPELYYSQDGLIRLDKLIHLALTKHAIPNENIFIGGMSASGTRAMRYTQYCNAGRSNHGINIAGVFSVDSPLDLERFYYSVQRNGDRFKAGMHEEAKMMRQVFSEQFGGSPKTHQKEYRDASVYSHLDEKGGNGKWLLPTPTLLIHEPDIDWWSNERGAAYYDINSFDMAGLYTFLKNQGHEDVVMLTTTGKGFNRKGERNCHSWSIVDEELLINWLLSQKR